MSAAVEAVDAYEVGLKAKYAEPRARLAAHQYKDSVLAETLAEGWSSKYTYRAPLRETVAYADGEWYIWNGRVWEHKKDPDAVEVVRLELRDMFTHDTKDPDLKAEEVKRAAVLLNKTTASNVLYFLKGLLSVSLSEFDTHAEYLNVQNGILNLRTGALLEHDPLFRFTKITAVEYNSNARHADWDMALEALPSDVRDWMQVRYGQAITGYAVDDDVIPIQTGDGSNGKSAQVTGMVKALGDFGIFVSDKVLLANQNEHPAAFMPLRGARFAVLEETPEGAYLPTKKLKDLAGTTVMNARGMRQDWVSWDATHTLLVNTNFVPQIAETDGGTWRRLALVKYPYKFIDPDDPIMAPNERHGDPGLRERLRDNPDGQWEAILAWLVKGALAWFANGRRQLPTPLTVRADTASWREETDVVLAYAMSHLEFDPASKVLTSDLYEDFTEWLVTAGKTKLAENTLAARLEAHELFKKNNVSKATRSRDHSGLDRPHVSWKQEQKPTPAQATMWVGVRFKPRETAPAGEVWA